MSEYRVLNYGDVLPASFLAALQEFIGTGAATLHLSLANSTTLQVAAGTASAQVGLGIDGLWRYIRSNITAAVTGAAGVYDVFAVTGPNSFSNTPNPDTDNTNYAFALQALPQGNTPTITSTVTNFRKIGECDWSGSAITGLRQLEGNLNVTAPLSPTAPAAGVAPVRAIGASGQTAPLQTWETPAGTVVASMLPDGTMTSTADTGWVAASLATNWLTVAPYPPIRYRVKEGLVLIDGWAENRTGSSWPSGGAFALIGVTPPATQRPVVIAQAGPTAGTLAVLTINNTGHLSVNASVPSASGVYVSATLRLS